MSFNSWLTICIYLFGKLLLSIVRVRLPILLRFQISWISCMPDEIEMFIANKHLLWFFCPSWYRLYRLTHHLPEERFRWGHPILWWIIVMKFLSHGNIASMWSLAIFQELSVAYTTFTGDPVVISVTSVTNRSASCLTKTFITFLLRSTRVFFEFLALWRTHFYLLSFTKIFSILI